ncbi:MAG: hypothetical protein SFV52_03430 [Saprospiraceae bacterium]|nr:hypothetical protein [Saprospiraceae bacterium]
MKNKHLVILFLFVLLSGWLVSRLWPWGRGQALRAVLLEADTARAEALQVLAPGYPPWSLHRAEGGWTLMAENRSMPMTLRQAELLLAMAAQVTSLRVIHTSRADTLGLGPGQSVQLTWTFPGAPDQRLYLGRETPEGTWVKLPGQQAVFLAEGRLRSRYAVDARLFRSKIALDWALSTVDSLVFERGDTVRVHQKASEQNRQWLRAVLPDGERPFADFFDETRAGKLELARLTLLRDSTSAELRLYRWEPLNLPEDLHELRKAGPLLPPYVWHSTANPLNFFVQSDTLQAALFLEGPPPMGLRDSVQHED